jgi:Uma2 family endonuclease
VLEPDVVVFDADELDDKHLTKAPHLVVEVLSPSTRVIDLGTKKLLYERGGVPDYWVVDPDVPALTVF